MSGQHTTEIEFRGTKREVEFEHEGSGVVVWWFTGASSTDDGHDGASDAEEQVVYDQLWAWLEDWWAPRPEDYL